MSLIKLIKKLLSPEKSIATASSPLQEERSAVVVRKRAPEPKAFVEPPAGDASFAAPRKVAPKKSASNPATRKDYEDTVYFKAGVTRGAAKAVTNMLPTATLIREDSSGLIFAYPAGKKSDLKIAKTFFPLELVEKKML